VRSLKYSERVGRGLAGGGGWRGRQREGISGKRIDGGPGRLAKSHCRGGARLCHVPRERRAMFPCAVSAPRLKRLRAK